MLSQIRHLPGLIRLSHTVFALPFALLSAALAWQLPDSPFSLSQLFGILLCMVCARSAAMAFNRIVDRQFDALNPRTEKRHLPAGLLRPATVIAFTILSSVGFILATLIFLPNPWPWRLSIPVLLFLLGYSYAKRFTVWCHFWLSAALMLSPLATWIAIRGEVAITPALLSAVIFFWVGGFDILYACQDADFDRQRNLFSIPSRWGVPVALRVVLICHLITIVSLFAFWHFSGLGTVFLFGSLSVAALLIYEHSLVTPTDLTRVNIAFFNVNAVVSIGLLAIGLADLWWTSAALKAHSPAAAVITISSR
jgi:4-hydroxybenzoate polyprenyltransferase